MNLNNYNANSIKTLKPREAIRENYAMYIGDNTYRGLHHLATEIIANSMDEAAAGFGTKILVSINTKNNLITITDEGRGIPFQKNDEGKHAIIEMCTSLHSGGKFNNAKNYKSSLGLHGLGATVTNALSKYFKIEVKRKDGSCLLEFQNGEITSFLPDENSTFSKTGTIVSFIPDEEIFGSEKWNKKILQEELQLHALLNNNLQFELYEDDKKVCSYCYSNGIKDMLLIKFGDRKPLTKPFYYKTIINEGMENECSVELGIQYANDGLEHTYAFTNGGYNPDLGTHVTGFRSAWTSLINNKARELKLLNDQEDNLDGALIRRGLCVIISIKMNERPMFAEQTKLKLTSPSARAIVSQAVGKLPLAKADVEAIVKKALLEKKAEDAAQRKREAEKRILSGGKINQLTDLPEKFAGANGKSGLELFIVEGETKLNCPYLLYI